MWRWAFQLDIWSTHDQPASCRARPLNVEDGLEDSMCLSSGWREVARVDALVNEVFWTPWRDEYKNSLSRTNLTGNIYHVSTLISISKCYNNGQSGTRYNSREQSTTYHNIRRRLSLCCCSVPVYLVSCLTSRYVLRLEATHYVYDNTAVVWDLL